MSFEEENLIAPNISDQTCRGVGYQPATICVPVDVFPFAKAGTTTTYCCGPAIINSKDCRENFFGHCDGVAECKGEIEKHCSFTITQRICVEVPVKFGATATVGKAYIECDKASDKMCSGCGVHLTETRQDEDCSCGEC